jgi:hypothetical protein
MTQWEREEEQLCRDLNCGLLSPAEFNKQMRELQRDMRDEMLGAAEEAADRAYRDECERW